MTIEIADCTRRPDEPHTAVSVEGACIHGVTLYGQPAQVCGECIHYTRRREPERKAKP